MKGTLKGLILAGGASRRLGRDKRQVLWSGQSLLERALDLAGQCCEEVWVSGCDLVAEKAAGWLPDAIPGIGPIAGVLTGLRTLRCPLLVLACDMPLLKEAMLHRLLDAWQEKPEDRVMTAFVQENGFIQSLAAIYEPAAVPFLTASVERGEYSLRLAIPPEKRHPVAYAGYEARYFFNLNSPEDLEKLRLLDETVENGS